MLGTYQITKMVRSEVETCQTIRKKYVKMSKDKNDNKDSSIRGKIITQSTLNNFLSLFDHGTLYLWTSLKLFRPPMVVMQSQWLLIDQVNKVSSSQLLFIALQKTLRYYSSSMSFSKHGIPEHVTSDRGPEFISHFFRSLGKALDMKLHYTSGYHPEGDGQTECTNQTLEQYLCIFCNYQQDNWKTLLFLAEFAYNNAPSNEPGYGKPVGYPGKGHPGPGPGASILTLKETPTLLRVYGFTVVGWVFAG